MLAVNYPSHGVRHHDPLGPDPLRRARRDRDHVGCDPGEPVEGVAKCGTVDWLFREYKLSVAYHERVSERTRGDYERIMCDLRTGEPRREIASVIGPSRP